MVTRTSYNFFYNNTKVPLKHLLLEYQLAAVKNNKNINYSHKKLMVT